MVLKRLKKVHPDGRNGYLPSSDCRPDKPEWLFPRAIQSNEAGILTQKHRPSGGVAAISSKFRPSAVTEINQTKEDAMKMKSREQMGRDNDIGKTVRPPTIDIGPKHLKVRGLSFLSDEQAGLSICQMPENDERTDHSFLSGVSSSRS